MKPLTFLRVEPSLICRRFVVLGIEFSVLLLQYMKIFERPPKIQK